MCSTLTLDSCGYHYGLTNSPLEFWQEIKKNCKYFYNALAKKRKIEPPSNYPSLNSTWNKEHRYIVYITTTFTTYHMIIYFPNIFWSLHKIPHASIVKLKSHHWYTLALLQALHIINRWSYWVVHKHQKVFWDHHSFYCVYEYACTIVHVQAWR